MQYIELVDYNELYFTDKPKKKKTRRRGGAKSASKTPALEVENVEVVNEKSSKVKDSDEGIETTVEKVEEEKVDEIIEEKIETESIEQSQEEKKEEDTEEKIETESREESQKKQKNLKKKRILMSLQKKRKQTSLNKTKYEYINLRIKHILFYPFFIT